MTNLTTEQIREILDGAPDGATHYDEEGDYWAIDCCNKGSLLTSGGRDEFVDIQYSWRSLSDLREILVLRERVAELEDGLQRLASAVDFFEKVDSAHPEERVAVGNDHFVWLIDSSKDAVNLVKQPPKENTNERD